MSKRFIKYENMYYNQLKSSDKTFYIIKSMKRNLQSASRVVMSIANRNIPRNNVPKIAITQKIIASLFECARCIYCYATVDIYN